MNKQEAIEEITDYIDQCNETIQWCEEYIEYAIKYKNTGSIVVITDMSRCKALGELEAYKECLKIVQGLDI